MKSIATFSVLATLATATHAALSETFSLATRSQNATFNNKYVGLCHQGALYDSLCVGQKDVDPTNTSPGLWFLNLTQAGPRYLQQGILTYNSTAVFNQELYRVQEWQYTHDTNVVMSFFSTPGGHTPQTQDLVVDSEGKLGLPQPPIVDTTSPDFNIKYTPKEMMNRWYACHTFYPGAYQSISIVWGLGAPAPQNPTCVKVDLVMIKSAKK